MLFDKKLFESKYVKPEERVPIDTLFLIGNGFDIWQGFKTSYVDFEKYYEEHLDEILAKLNIKKKVLLDKKKNKIIDKNGNPITYSDVEFFYSNPYKPKKLKHDFWWNFEASLDKVDDQEITYFFDRSSVKNIKTCSSNACRILQEAFFDWINTIKITDERSIYDLGENSLFINFNYTNTLIKRFDVKEINEYHIHGSVNDKNSIIFGHSTHPELPYELLRMYKNKERMEGLYYIEEFSYNTDKHIEDNYMKLRVFCALHGIRIKNIKKIYVLGFGFGDADLGYIKNLINETEGILRNPEEGLTSWELNYLNEMDIEREKLLNMEYAISHRERIMKKKPKSFPKEELIEEIIKLFVDEPYYNLKRKKQIKLATAAVQRRYHREQEERNNKIKKEYLRMLRKKMNLKYLTLEEAFLGNENRIVKKLKGAEWHISYFNEKDKEKIEKVMSEFGCQNYTLYNSIDKCIEKFKIK